MHFVRIAPFLLALASAATPYSYLSYDGIVSRLKSLNTAHPELVELYNAQDPPAGFRPVPSPGTCAEGGAAASPTFRTTILSVPCVESSIGGHASSSYA